VLWISAPATAVVFLGTMAAVATLAANLYASPSMPPML
jgi:hypothetical protein